MERFNLNTWLEDKSRKIVTRDGKPARIICYDVKQGKDDCYVPIIALVDKGEEIGEMSYYYSEDGRFLRNPNQTHNLDLFFADEEEELTDFEKAVEKTIPYKIPIDMLKSISQQLLDLAIKEIEKENPYSGNQKQEWSEEDEKMLTSTIEYLNEFKEVHKKGAQECIIWLKSIKDAIEYNKMFPQEEFVSKKQYEEDLGKAYKNADKVQFNRGMDEILNNPQKYFHVGDTIRLKNSNVEHTITSIFNGKYYGERWCLDIIKAADDYELVEDCNEVSNNIDYSSEIIGFLKNYIKTYGCTAMNSWVKWLEKKCNI